MPEERQTRQRSRDAGRAYVLGDYWLNREPGNQIWYYYWHDKKSRRTRRATTRTSDLEEAKARLAEIVLKEGGDKRVGGTHTKISSVQARYLKQHGEKIRSAPGIKRAFRMIFAYMRERQETSPTIGDFNLVSQRGFALWCVKNHDLKPKSIATYLVYYAAALRVAARPIIIKDAKGHERESQLIESAPFVMTSEQEISKLVDRPVSQPRDFIPTDEDLARVLDHIREIYVRRYCIMALNLWARPEAIMELRVKAQVDFGRGLVHLNPPGRRQNNKHRPTVRLTDNLRGWLIHWNRDAPLIRVNRDGHETIVPSVDNRSLKQAAKDAGVPNPHLWNRYTLRHYMATRIRRVPGIEVSREQRAEWLGHSDRANRTTERWYESLDPDHLVAAQQATDAIMTMLGTLCRKSLQAPSSAGNSGTRLQIVPGNISESEPKKATR
jgi:hypothetical protein